MDIVPETVNRIRLSDTDLVLLYRVLQKVEKEKLTPEEAEFYRILTGRVKGRLKLKNLDPDSFKRDTFGDC